MSERIWGALRKTALSALYKWTHTYLLTTETCKICVLVAAEQQRKYIQTYATIIKAIRSRSKLKAEIKKLVTIALNKSCW